MSSRAGSTFLTFLVSIPLAAMGLMAVFGVPPLATVIAASRGLTDSSRGVDGDSRNGRDSTQSQFEDWDSGTAPEWKSGDADLTDIEGGTRDATSTDHDELGFSKAPREEEDSHTTRSRTNGSRSKPESLESDRWADNSPSNPRSLLSPRGGSKAEKSRFAVNADPDRNAPPISMKESLKKLNSLGVKHYHLERGSDQDTWLFVCLFVPGDDARLTHRFESESDDPDRAAAETVKQIDSWLLQRFRDKQSISQNAM